MSAPERTPLSSTTGTRPSDGLDDRRKRIHRRDRAIDLAAAVVGDDDPVHPVLDRRGGVCGVQDPLEEDRQSRPLAQEREVVPGERRARVRLDEPTHRRAREPGADVGESRPRIRASLAEQGSDRRECDPARCRCLLPQRLLERFDEHRVARVLGDPLSAEERQVREIEVANAPAEHRRVEREDDRTAPAPLSPRDEARDELVRRAPVELEPARCVAHGTCCFLHRARGLVREDERDALRGGCARYGDVRLAVRHLEDADRTEDERARQLACRATSVAVSLTETSRSIRGTMRQRSNAARFSRIVSSVPAPPAT